MNSGRRRLWNWVGLVLTALTLAAVPWAVAQSHKGTPGFTTYDYAETDEGVEKAVRLAIPDGRVYAGANLAARAGVGVGRALMLVRRFGSVQEEGRHEDVR